MEDFSEKITNKYFKIVGLNDEQISVIIKEIGFINEILEHNRDEIKQKLKKDFDEKTINKILNYISV